MPVTIMKMAHANRHHYQFCYISKIHVSKDGRGGGITNIYNKMQPSIWKNVKQNSVKTLVWCQQTVEDTTSGCTSDPNTTQSKI